MKTILQMRAMLTTAGPIALGLSICLVLLVVSQSILLQMPWLQPALTVETSFDLLCTRYSERF